MDRRRRRHGSAESRRARRGPSRDRLGDPVRRDRHGVHRVPVHAAHASSAAGRCDKGFQRDHAEHRPGRAGPAAAHVDRVHRAARLAIACLLVMRSNGWIISKTTPIELALLVLALVAVVLGLRAMILVSISISDPVREVVDAMAEVERGEIDTIHRRLRVVRNRATAKWIQPHGRWPAGTRTAARSVRPARR